MHFFRVMIGLDFELLLYLTSQPHAAEKIGVTPQKIVRLRDKISQDRLSERMMNEMLTRFGCTCVRPAIVVPAVIADRYGRKFTEDTYIKQVRHYKLVQDIHIHNLWGLPFPSEETVHKICTATKGRYIAKRQYLRAVWSYERPWEENVMERNNPTVVRKIIGLED